jgi:hypothetical protein
MPTASSLMSARMSATARGESDMAPGVAHRPGAEGRKDIGRLSSSTSASGA